MKKIALFFAAVPLAFLSSCGTTSLYNWSSYTNDTYQYVKKGDDESSGKLLETYQKIIDDQQKTVRQTVPPGIYGDYGYFLVKAGKIEEGKEFLNKEKELYPESALFIDSILKKIGD